MRLFVGFRLADEVVNRILDIQSKLSKNFDYKEVIRWVLKNNLHITAVFLGKVDEKHVSFIKQVIGDINSEYKVIEFCVLNFGLWPKERSPRIISIQLNHPSKYGQLQAELALQLAPYAPKIGKFKPAHITIARVNKKINLKDKIKLNNAIATVKFPIRKVTFTNLYLFQSILSRKGSDYRIL